MRLAPAYGSGDGPASGMAHARLNPARLKGMLTRMMSSARRRRGASGCRDQYLGQAAAREAAWVFGPHIENDLLHRGKVNQRQRLHHPYWLKPKKAFRPSGFGKTRSATSWPRQTWIWANSGIWRCKIFGRIRRRFQADTRDIKSDSDPIPQLADQNENVVAKVDAQIVTVEIFLTGWNG